MEKKELESLMRRTYTCINAAEEWGCKYDKAELATQELEMAKTYIEKALSHLYNQIALK
jgi:hypothetical protein